MPADPPYIQQDLETASGNRDAQHYVLRLYVAGLTPRSQAAIKNLAAICEQHLADRYDLEVIDIYQHPGLARNDQIVAAPTLVKQLPDPLRTLVGSLADEERVLVGLDLRPQRG